MEYKEKLRLAKEALDSGSYDKETIEYIFPELTESKDERIKKSLIRLVKAFYDVNFPIPEGFTKEQLLSWLEKQGEKKPDTDFSDLKTWKYIVEAVWTEKDDVGLYFDSPFNDKVAKKLQKRFGNIEQKPILDVEIPFGTDSELVEEAITIPYGCYAIIEDNKVILRKGEQKPAGNIESSTFKDKLLELFQKFRYIKESVPTNGDIIDYVDAHIQELIDTMQKPAEWSEEEEMMLKEMNEFFDTHKIPSLKHYMDDYAKFIKSIKDRVQPQLEQKWSEEDEGMLQTVINRLELSKNRNASEISYVERCVDWLKFLKERYIWKPSDEKMDNK